MRISKLLAAVAAFFVIGAVVAGCGSSIPGDAVANVAGNPVTLRAFDHWFYVATKSQDATYAEEGETVPFFLADDPPQYTQCIKEIRDGYPEAATLSTASLRADCANQYSSTAGEVMNFLVEGYWYQYEAHALKISDKKILAGFKAYLKQHFPTKAALKSYIQSSGWTLADIKFQYLVSTLYGKLLKHYEKPATKKAIAAYYEAHKSQFGTQTTDDLHLVRTNTMARAQAALAELKAGQSWDTVAKKYSEDASAKANGGLLESVTPGEEEAAVSKAIFSASVGKLVGPVHGVFGWYVLQVTHSTPGTQEPLSKVAATIKTTLTQTAESSAETALLNASKKKWLKRTTCRSPYESQTVCSNYVAIKIPAVPQTTTTTTPTTSSTSTTSSTGSTATTTATATTATKTSK